MQNTDIKCYIDDNILWSTPNIDYENIISIYINFITSDAINSDVFMALDPWLGYVLVVQTEDFIEFHIA